tara:strand:+ start:451 stop:690 length:240 start_codon:yes stop_codon:yes gene_type:complete
MANKKDLKKVVSELKNASKMHLAQSKTIDRHINSMERNSPLPGLASPLVKKGPCWRGYEMIGMKKKGGRTVPNCVPKKK